MLALDHRGSFKKLINPQNPDSVVNEEVIQIKSKIIETLREQFSGLLVDPRLGLQAYKNRTKPYLLCIEKSGYIKEADEMITELEFSVEELQSYGASGIKLLLYFSPLLPSSKIQLSTAKQVLSGTTQANLPLFLELVTYAGHYMVEDSVKIFVEKDILPSVFKLEYPGNLEACKEVTKILNPIPWIMLTRGENYDLFKTQLKDAISGGAKGFLAGRTIWQEAVSMKNQDERLQFLKEVVAKRFKEISEIALNN